VRIQGAVFSEYCTIITVLPFNRVVDLARRRALRYVGTALVLLAHCRRDFLEC